MISSPLPRGLIVQLKVIPFSLWFLHTGGFVGGINLMASLLIIYSVASYLLLISNLNLSAFPLHSKFLLISTTSLIPTILIGTLWIVYYRIDKGFLHHISGLMAISSSLLMLPMFPGTANLADSVVIIQFIIYIGVILTELHKATLVRSLNGLGWTSSNQESSVYQWAVLSAARCYLYSVCIALTALYFSKIFYASLISMKSHIEQTSSFTRINKVVKVGKAGKIIHHGILSVPTLSVSYVVLVYILHSWMWYRYVWSSSSVSQYAPEYYGLRDLILFYIRHNISSIREFISLTFRYTVYLLIFIFACHGYFIYLIRELESKSYLSDDLRRAFYRKGFHVLYLIVILTLFNNPVLFFILCTVVIIILCILEAMRGRISWPFYTWTQQFVSDKRRNVELSHIHLLLSGSVFQAIYFSIQLSAGPVSNEFYEYNNVCHLHHFDLWRSTLYFIQVRDTRSLMYDSFLSAGIVTTVLADAFAVYSCIIYALIKKVSPNPYRNLLFIKFKRNFTITSPRLEKKRLKSLQKSEELNELQIPDRLNGVMTKFNGSCAFVKMCHNACLTKRRTPIGSMGFAVSCFLICTVVYKYSARKSIILAIVTALSEALSSMDNAILPFIFINLYGILHYK